MLHRPACQFLLLPFLLLSAALLPVSAAAASDVKCVGDGFKLSGSVPDIHRHADCAGHRFRVTLSDMRYVGEVNKTLLEQSGNGEITVWISLKDVRVTIGRISLSGRPGRALCGPTVIDIANRRDLWIAFDFERPAEGRDELLTLKQTRTGLHPDNWAVGSPSWVKTSGFGMSRNTVSRGVRTGLAQSRSDMEQQIEQIAHSVLTEFAAQREDVRAEKVGMEQALARKLVMEGHLSRDGQIVLQSSHTAIREKGTEQ